MNIISRRDAAELGAKHFFTGNLCKGGHVSPRYVSTGSCVACQSAFTRKSLNAAGLLSHLPAQTVHPDDREEILKLIDFFNINRGLPPAVRPGQMPLMPTPWEVYLTKEMRRPFRARPSLKEMERAARVQGIEVAYATMTPPVDNWSQGPGALSPFEAVEARKLPFARALEKDGYAPDEQPT